MQQLIVTWPHALFFWLVLAWVAIPELRLVVKRGRAKSRAEPLDSGSAHLIVASTQLAIPAAFAIAMLSPGATALPQATISFYTGLATLLAAGLLRRHCMRMLGECFTIAVIVAPDHLLIERGAYRWVRHPSYAASLLAHAGLGLSLTNWLSLVLLLATAVPSYAYRIVVEERALARALGEPYSQYVRRTRRLIPFLY